MIDTLLTLLPPELFPPEMQPIIYFTLLPTIIGLQSAIMFIIYFFVMPPEAKLYLWNKLKKYPMIDYETDDGVRAIEMIKPYTEGVNYGMKTGNTYLTPRPISNELILKVITPDLEEMAQKMKSQGKTDAEIEEAANKKVDEEIKKVREMERVILRPSIVKGLGVPIYRAYQSKAIATTLAHLVGLEYSGNSKSTNIAVPIVKKTGKRIDPVELNLGKDKRTDEWIMNTSLPVDPNVVKKWFRYMWTQSQIKASNRISEEIGREKEEGYWKKMIMVVVVIGALLAIGIVAMMIGQG